MQTSVKFILHTMQTSVKFTLRAIQLCKLRIYHHNNYYLRFILMKDIYQYSAKDNQGNETKLSNYQGEVLLIVNTASNCGFTPQYQGLQNLYQQYQTQGFEVLAFPCNQFKQQEQGSDEDIRQFCDLHFNIKFPLFEKIEVNGENSHPLYKYLKEQAPGILGSKAIKWNFTKFLVNKKGHVIKRYAPTTKPEDISADIALELTK